MTQRQSFLVRFSEEERAALRGYAHATGRPMNDVVRTAVRSYLTGEGRHEHVRAATDRLAEQYGVAMEKLRDM